MGSRPARGRCRLKLLNAPPSSNIDLAEEAGSSGTRRLVRGPAAWERRLEN